MTDTCTPEPTIDEFRGRVAELRALVEAAERGCSRSPVDATSPARETSPSRRQLLRMGGAAVVGAVAAGAVASGTSHAAGALATETTNLASSPTGLAVTGTNKSYGFGVTDNGLNFVPTAVSGAAVLGHAAGKAFRAGVTGYGDRDGVTGVVGSVVARDGVGVSGIAEGDQAIGVTAFASGVGATGLRAVSEAGHAVVVSGGVAAILIEATRPELPPAPHVVNSVHCDTTGRLWHCVASGSPGTWRLISGPATAGALVPIAPVRVYDSRIPLPGSGALGLGATRTVTVAHGIDPVRGAAVTFDVVPQGATAIAYNLTITETVGSGFLAVAPGDATSSPSSSINWSSTGQTLANGLISKIDVGRQIKVFSGGSGTAQFIVDVNGYWR